ncbi:MAG: ankyrin repeat domain-containing protein, partial [Sulfuritalea sp.]|nr:ankyrin repeat domain-containing protein [Sulfuritalea sp.]
MTTMHQRFFSTASFILSVLMMVTMKSAYANEDVSYLLTAASKGDLAIVNAILASGANANVKDEDGLTVLMYA